MPELHDLRPTRAIRMLVVDDEPSVLEFIERILSDAGSATVMASDDPEAMNRIQLVQPLLLKGLRRGGRSVGEGDASRFRWTSSAPTETRQISRAAQ